MNIFIVGASGFIGSAIVDGLDKKDNTIFISSRSENDSRANTIVCDFSKDFSVDFWKEKLKNIDIVINAVGIISESKGQKFADLHAQAPIALFKACEQLKVKKVIQISALGADANAITQYHKSKKAADEYLRSTKLHYYILKPSIVYGEDGVSTELFKGLAALPITPIVDDGEQLLQPIYIGDLVKTINACIADAGHENLELDLVGPKAITYKELLRLFRAWLQKRPAFELKIPQWLSFMGKVLNEPAISKDNLIMLKQGNSADVQPLEDFLGTPLRSMQETIFFKNATPAQKLAANFYFMPILGRFVLGFIWIWTAIVSGFLYPHDQSIALLNDVGISGVFEEPLLYISLLLDFIIGILTIAGWRLKELLIFQFLVIVVYTTILTLFAPYHWLHPFGPVSKNLALLMVILMMMLMKVKK